MAQRPLSPHLTIWTWGPHMAVSILHRISGQGLAFVGLEWQRSLSSNSLRGVGRDGERIARCLAALLARR